MKARLYSELAGPDGELAFPFSQKLQEVKSIPTRTLCSDDTLSEIFTGMHPVQLYSLFASCSRGYNVFTKTFFFFLLGPEPEHISQLPLQLGWAMRLNFGQ